MNKTLFSSPAPSNLHGTPQVLINEREMRFPPGVGDRGEHQHQATLAGSGAGRSRLKMDGMAGHFIQERWKK